MEVSYTTTIDDLVDAMVHFRRNMPFLRRVNQLLVAMIIVGGSLWTFIVFERSPAAAICVGLLTVASLAAYPRIHRVTEKRHVGRLIKAMGARGLIGRITLILTDESLTEQTETVRSVARWQDMNRVEAVGDCTYIYLTGMSMAIIPRHGFERDEDYTAVRAFVMGKLGMSTQVPALN